MTPVLKSVELFLLAGLAFAGIGSLLSAAITRVVGARCERWEPRTRHRVLVFLALLPLLTMVGLMFAVSLPALIGLAFPALDHCRQHDDGHAHLCFVHLPNLATNLPVLLGVVFVISYALMRALLASAAVLRSTRILRALAHTGEPRSDLGITLIESARPVCLAAGLWKPRVLISRGLIESLSDCERAVVLAHERAHVRRRDALVAALVRACTALHIPSVARWLGREIGIAAEQICDEEAATLVGDRVSVAAAILSVARASQRTTSNDLGGVALAFGESAVERRVKSLLAEPLPAVSLRPLAVLLVLLIAVLCRLSGELHHTTETAVSLIAQ